MARLPLALLFVVAACVSTAAPSPTSVVPAGDGPRVVSGATTTVVGADAALRRFVECMQEGGVAGVEPRVDATGRVVLADLVKTNDVADPVFRRALQRCGGVLVDAGLLTVADDAELASALRDDLRQFTSCMRTEGVEAFPAPLPSFDGTGPAFDPEAIPYEDADLAAALEVCRARIAGG